MAAPYRSRMRFLLEGVEGIGVLLGALVTWPLARRWLWDWGSRPAERERAWPGDALVPAADRVHTRAVTVAAPPRRVWPWVAQFGLGRAGFYSYELLERVAGIPVTNVERILPAFQSLAVGDEIQLHPRAPGIPIAALEPERHVCFGGAGDGDRSEPDPARSWSIYVEPEPGDTCRLVLRGCVAPPRAPSWRTRAAAALEAPIDFVMEQRMLRTIKRLAEAA